MIDMATVEAALAATQHLQGLFTSYVGNRAKALAEHELRETLESVGKMQTALYEMRSELLRLQGINAGLEKSLEEIDEWKQRFSNYQIVKTDGGAHVYAFDGEPVHYICTACVEKKQIQILQDSRVVTGTFHCPGCNATFPIKAHTFTRL